MRFFVIVLLSILLAACQSTIVTPTPPIITPPPTVVIPTQPPTPLPTVAIQEESTVSENSAEVEAEPEPQVEADSEGQTETEPEPEPEPTTPPAPTLAQTVALEKVSEGFERPVYLTHAGDERLMVVEKRGIVSVILNNERQSGLFLDIANRVGSQKNERGLLGLAFHPDFQRNQRLFVYYTDLSGSVIIAEFTASADLQTADPNSERILITAEQPFANHNGGALVFGPDGYLYIGLGDGGSANDPEYNGLDRSTLLGALLRIDVDTGDPYGIPADNPFVSDETARNEIWAYGLRNPWRISFDSETGDLFTGDVGQNEWEEINWQSADSGGGANYGWNAWEATHCFTDECELFTDTVMPIIEYDHSQGCSVTGGYVYRGTQSPALTGNYLYADFCSGNIWGAVSAESEWQTSLLAKSSLLISSFGVDVNNELYVLDYNGVVYRVSAE